MFENNDSQDDDDSSDESDAIDAAIRQATGGKAGNHTKKRQGQNSELDFNNHEDDLFSDGESAKGKYEEKVQKKLHQKNAW